MLWNNSANWGVVERHRHGITVPSVLAVLHVCLLDFEDPLLFDAYSPCLCGNIRGTSPLHRACGCSSCLAAAGRVTLAVCVSGAFSLRAAFKLAARPPTGAAGAEPGVLGSAAAPEAPESPCSEALSLFIRVVTLTAFCEGWKPRWHTTKPYLSILSPWDVVRCSK